ncbi:LysR family transcriptional regulator [Streptomyces sp. NPDC093591]|uniref:LysR family transcriptional regulator n=1 Tax=Streptomyces sp. NPDC093591 TaxID=3366044 RepID=UPI0037FA77D2
MRAPGTDAQRCTVSPPCLAVPGHTDIPPRPNVLVHRVFLDATSAIHGHPPYPGRTDLRWLRVLVELADHGTLRAAADVTGYSTSAVSQQLAALQRSFGVVLVEPVGRTLALTPAGRAFLPHARTILATLDTARGDLAPQGPLTGRVRLAGYATSLARHVIPAVTVLREQHPGLSIAMEEREPAEVRELLYRDEIDIGVVYDLSLVPRGLTATAYHQVPMELAVAAADDRTPEEIIADPATNWIANSRAGDDDRLIHHVTARYDISPRIAHHVDSLDLVLHLIAAGLGTALVAADGPRRPDVRHLPLHGLAGTRRSYALTRPGREKWHATAAVISAVAAFSGCEDPRAKLPPSGM